jgi:glycyl-tRNA synthetase beta chain
MSDNVIEMPVMVEEEPAVATLMEEPAAEAAPETAPVREAIAHERVAKVQVANDFILEVGVEEIPAWMIEPALAQLRKALGDVLKKEVQVFGTPRRLVACVLGLPKSQPDTQEQLTGPPKKAPQQAAEAFAKKCGVPIAKLETITTPKGEYWSYLKREKGQKTAELLETLLPQTILGLHWPKTMYWTAKNGPRFIRPIRSLLALLGSKVVRFEVGGVKSGNTTFGHRALGKPKLKVTDFEQYKTVLRENGVILDAEERRSRIIDGAKAPLPTGCRLRSNPGLVNTLVYLTEFPTAALGVFDPSYLTLPEEVLATVMEHHQKYLAVEMEDGRLAPNFVFVMNRGWDESGIVRHGNERVLRARFNDARFFWDVDQKIPLRDRGPMLEKVTFQAKLGSYAAKTARVVELARELAPQFGADVDATVRATELAKTDLTTELVKEFTELQGIVGGLYARAQGEPEKAAAAVYDQYKPESMDDSSPRTLEGAAMAVADKLDTLREFFGLGIVPSGSKDPFALRRAAQGIVKILADHGVGISLGNLAVSPELRSFFDDRLRFYLRDTRGFAYDEVNAVLTTGADALPDILARLRAVAAVRSTPNLEPLATAFKRIKNILAKSAPGGEIDPALLEDGPERDLHASATRISEETSGLSDYEEILRRTAELRPAVDLFFDKVLVMAEDERIRRNRLALLHWLLSAFTRVADFSELITSKEKETTK